MAKKTKITKLSEVKLVDEFGLVKADIALLEEKADLYKAEFTRRNKPKFYGKLYTVSVSSFVRTTLSKDALEKEMGEDFVNRFLKYSDSITRVVAYVRNVRKAA